MNEWVYMYSSGWPGYRNIVSGEWLYSDDYHKKYTMKNIKEQRMSKFDVVTKVHMVMFEDASGKKHDTKEKAEASNRLLKFEHYFTHNIDMDDLKPHVCSWELSAFLIKHKNAILELLLDKKHD